MPFGFALLAANAIALLLMTTRGDRPERLAAALISAAIMIEPFAQPVQIGTWRIGILVVNAILLLGLWVLTEVADRWWLVVVTALQLLLVLSAAMPLMSSDFGVATGVTVRMALWTLISLCLFIAVWEAQAAQRFAREARNHDPNSLDL